LAAIGSFDFGSSLDSFGFPPFGHPRLTVVAEMYLAAVVVVAGIVVVAAAVDLETGFEIGLGCMDIVVAPFVVEIADSIKMLYTDRLQEDNNHKGQKFENVRSENERN